MKKWAYYNDIDPFCCEWVRNLIEAGVIMDGEVDGRSIKDVTPSELMGFERVHMFCGIAGWDHALNLAGWEGEVWTGSCPCQSFSTAGRGAGFADERHLWPYWFHLIRECQPSAIFGEQVASKAALEWLDLVSDDLEGEGYAVGAADLCAASVGAFHIRQRLWFVGYSPGNDKRRPSVPAMHREGEPPGGSSGPGIVADAPGFRCGSPGEHIGGSQGAAVEAGRPERNSQDNHGIIGQQIPGSAPCHEEAHGGEGRNGGQPDSDNRPASDGENFWHPCEWLPCRDGKWRPTKPGLQPLAYGVSGRVGRLRAYGNSIVPEVGAEFIRAVL
jgi:DNA (cytosine-5)-methyltransferase 1